MLALMRTKGLSVRGLDGETRAALKGFVSALHVEGGMSLTDLAKLIGNKTSGYTSWLCRELGVKARPFEEARLRGIREKRRKYERRPFDGTDEDRAYLLGLRHGDLSVSEPWKGVVRVSTSTTHPAMAELFTELFGRYGHVYQHARFKNDTGSYEWNLSVIVDETFGFLVGDRGAQRASLNGVLNIQSYLAGVLDAEGSIGIFENARHVALIISIYNTDLSLLGFVKGSLLTSHYHVLGPYLDKRKGTITSKYKIARKKDYWRVAVAVFEDCQALLRSLPLRHPEKRARKELALSIRKGMRWESVLPQVQSLRDSVRADRDRFVEVARRTYLASHQLAG